MAPTAGATPSGTHGPREELLAPLQERFPDEDFFIDELVRYGRKDLGIKDRDVRREPTSWSTTGPWANWWKESSREVEARTAGHRVLREFCRETKPRHHWYDQGECLCRARIVRKTSAGLLGRQVALPAGGSDEARGRGGVRGPGDDELGDVVSAGSPVMLHSSTPRNRPPSTR